MSGLDEPGIRPILAIVLAGIAAGFGILLYVILTGRM